MEKNENFKTQLENQYNILIKASAKEERKHYLIILSIVFLSFVSVIISVIFSFLAYRYSVKAKNEESSNINTYYQVLSINYNSSDSLNLSSIGNGYTLSNPKVIEITNEGDTNITYNIELTDITTSLLSTNNLIYVITQNGETIASQELPLSEKSILSDITISPNETITYIINVSYKGTMEENDYSNYYNSKINVEQTTNKTELLE